MRTQITENLANCPVGDPARPRGTLGVTAQSGTGQCGMWDEKGKFIFQNTFFRGTNYILKYSTDTMLL